jgi:hypothetical protein
MIQFDGHVSSLSSGYRVSPASSPRRPTFLILGLLGPDTVISHGKTPKRLSTFSLPFTFTSYAATLARAALAAQKSDPDRARRKTHTRFISLIRVSDRTIAHRYHEGPRGRKEMVYITPTWNLSIPRMMHAVTPTVFPISDIQYSILPGSRSEPQLAVSTPASSLPHLVQHERQRSLTYQSIKKAVLRHHQN